jgi:hypothetical protein
MTQPDDEAPRESRRKRLGRWHKRYKHSMRRGALYGSIVGAIVGLLAMIAISIALVVALSWSAPAILLPAMLTLFAITLIGALAGAVISGIRKYLSLPPSRARKAGNHSDLVDLPERRPVHRQQNNQRKSRDSDLVDLPDSSHSDSQRPAFDRSRYAPSNNYTGRASIFNRPAAGGQNVQVAKQPVRKHSM